MYTGRPSLYFKHFPNCTFEEFHAATGSGKQAWYDKRYSYKKKSLLSPNHKKMKKETRFIIENPDASFELFQKVMGGDKKLYIKSRSAASSYFNYHNLKNPIVLFKKKKFKQPEQASFEFKHDAEKNAFDEAVEIVQSIGRKEEPLINPQPWRQSTDEQIKRAQGDFVVKEERVSLGINPDFIWYESSQMRDELTHVFSKNMTRFERLVKAMEARHSDNHKMITDLMDQVRDLKSKNKALEEMLDRFTAPKG